ncbi:UDP-3-O-(3-hydroxymyristoyl)glucosamine N-acyltransferase [Spiribacter vilamensis]|uniref:UDP-3-O-acylglucosamine N-acyltransferase n=1 Tax=Spiribacter vilamensis TaxID=531306 RepID=A0A4Q8CZJ6_9GAMM|nr:UDP-3-O-(3-hydroxymyristoyl)glucosamine N-acyltransferase [Spiribacter vilamensis]RZU98456.1 UDP-3-O-[3-hydroxymyristoyl] glucosamine N-acyltransferase [Spiribacter vilamensis]TVO60670.1 UDP-3-O-(3-hydroxymyristoyl)glucosamine N-acyltransferase [Spiribacter vilamensis]
MAGTRYTLGELARLTGAELEGSDNGLITGVASLDTAGPRDVSFLANRRYRRQLADTRAAAVILPRQESSEGYGFAVLRADNPYLVFARIAGLLNPRPSPVPGIHPDASVSTTARVDASAMIGPRAVIEADARIGADCRIGPGAVIGAGVHLGVACRIDANASVLGGSRLGDRVEVMSGAVIGSAGFGFADAGDHWEAVPQLGRVWIGDDVSIGANTTVDRGSQGDTRIDTGCKIDNLVQIAHNVRIGAHTVIAANAGISGSTSIGRYCRIAGGVGFVGHIEIADGSTFTGMSMITGSINDPGVYSSGVPLMPTREWRRSAVRFRQLDDMARRLEKLERMMETAKDRDGR